ncbi:hypothetical protein LCGC14_1109340 [marine sediment metagenome]|uniref:Uncharacterized protein n=1 Tax=marine sediment metagenome TaxID=412755 RepID=A0A0F9QDI2_9ZZZZ
MTTKTETWLDIIPAIPLTPSVPITDGKRFGIVTDDASVTLSPWAIDPLYEHPNMRVDLDDPQGFGYAYRWLYPTPAYLHRTVPGMMGRHLRGETTHADRLALAKALREVVS